MSKILIIEDDESMVKLLSEVLEKNDFTIVTASDGLQGTTVAHQENPDLIILDLIMPVGGGETTLRNLKMSEHTKDTPIIVMSGTSDELLKEQISHMGIKHFFEKPFIVEKLVSKIKEILLK